MLKPVFQAVGMLAAALGSSFLIVALIYALFPEFEGLPWLANYMMGVVMLLISLFMIWRFSNGQFGDYGFNLRRRALKLAPSLWMGVIYAIAMALIDYLPPLLGGRFKLGYDPTFVNVLGTMSYMWIFVGITEETLFRALIQTYLMNHLRGNVKILRWHLRHGTIVAAIIFGLAHLFNIFSKPLEFVLPQVVYTTILGLILGYLYQETKSLAGPIIMHNSSDGLEHSIEYMLYSLHV